MVGSGQTWTIGGIIVNMENILKEIALERRRQIDLAHGGDTDKFDSSNSKNDWIWYIAAYAGRATDKCFRNERENCDFRENMIKVAALAVAAIEAHDKGFLIKSKCWACDCSINNSKEMCGMCWDCFSKRNCHRKL